MKISAILHIALTMLLAANLAASAEPRLRLLFLGDNGHHRPADRFAQLQPILASRGIELIYSDRVADLTPETLNGFDGLVVYANIEQISPEQEKALLDYVAAGKGFVPIHCASYCFLNSEKYVELVGAQFQRHTTGVFRDSIAEPDHPIMKGYRGFESWDETYVHHRHNTKDRVVLAYRVEGNAREPWTWVRTHGKGRVFYTAWGHDQRTWSNPGFHNLIERGIRWAVGRDPGVVPAFADRPEMTKPRADVKPFEYVEANVPFYPSGERWGVTGEPIKKMQKPLPAEESLKHYATPVGFEVRLFAAEPDIGKPICLNWDERGRLWIAETVDYPNDKQPEGQGNDRIRICSDTDGDGKADKFTVFADKLSIPTSLTFSNGGVIVQQAPHTLFLKDSDGDDRADVRKTIFTGWSTQDTHAGPSNLHYGFDNWIYGIVGYSGFQGRVGDETISFRTGFYRFKPDGSKLEFLRNTNNNSWGVGFSEDGTLFGSTANGNPSEHLPIPNRYYESVRGWSASALAGIADSNKIYPISDSIRQVDHHGGFTAAAGHALYTARTYPREYWNRTAFVTEPTGHLVATFVLTPNKATYQSRNSWNLLASIDEWASPIAAEVGPDGHVWVVDWYNYIVQHNPTPAGYRTGKGNAYVSDLRDKKHGRIYRVVYTAAPSEKPFSLEKASPNQLVEALRHPNLLWRRHAQRLLVERGDREIAGRLVALVNDPNVDEIGLNVGAIHALWTLHGLGVLDDSKSDAARAAVACLGHRSAGVRRNAALVLPRDEKSSMELLRSNVLQDADPQVRLAALLALSEMPASEPAGSAIGAALNDPSLIDDRWLSDALTSAAAANDRFILAALARDNKPGEWSTNKRTVVERLCEHYARGAPTDSVVALLLGLESASEPMREALLRGLERGWPKDKPVSLSSEAESQLMTLLPRLPVAAQSQLVGLAIRWGSKQFEEHAAKLVEGFLSRVTDEKQRETERIRAARQLVELRPRDVDLARKLLELITPRVSPQLAAGLIEAIGQSQAPEVGAPLVAAMPSLTPAGRSIAIRMLLGRAEWSMALLDGLDDRSIGFGELALDQKQQLTAHPNSEVASRARKLLSAGGGLPNPDRQKVLAELEPLAERKGDAEAGKTVFQKQCAKCHTHSGEGAKVGPDLTGMAVHPKKELLTQVLDPSRSVEGNFRAYTVVLTDGRILTGLLAAESRTAIEIFDSEGKKQTILREEIEEMRASTKSLMPEGFEKQVTSDDLVNLLEFLTRRGKYVPLPIQKAATVVSTRGMFVREEADVERLIFREWTPKTFAGVPFQLIDPQGDRVPNVILLHSTSGTVPNRMPRSVRVPCNMPTKSIHLLSGVSGWGFPFSEKGSVSMIVRLHYVDGKTEDHPLLNGEHFADYIRRVDVPKSEFAFRLRGQQIRYLSVKPNRAEVIREIEFVKGEDITAPVVMAVTAESGS